MNTSATQVERSKLVIGVKTHGDFGDFSSVIHESTADGVLIVMPHIGENVAAKGMLQLYMFAHRSVRENLRRIWETNWGAIGRHKNYSRKFDLDHVFPASWANLLQFDYLMLHPVYSHANRSAGAGIEKMALSPSNNHLLSMYSFIEGNFAYLTSEGAAKLMGDAPGSGSFSFPGMQKIEANKPKIMALLSP